MYESIIQLTFGLQDSRSKMRFEQMENKVTAILISKKLCNGLPGKRGQDKWSI